MTLDAIAAWLIAYKYLVLFPIMVVEGPIITVIAGFLSSLGHLDITLVYLFAVAGDLAGDALYYGVGYIGRDRLARRGKLLGISRKQYERVASHFHLRPGKFLFFGKLTHAIGWVILIAAGVFKIPLRSFVWFNFLATLPKTLVFVLIGYYFGEAYHSIDAYLNYLTAVLFVVFATITVAYLKKKSSQS